MNTSSKALLAALLGTGLVAMDRGDAATVPAANPQPAAAAEGPFAILGGWFLAHAADPYPSAAEKQRLAEASHLTVAQVSNWFINARARHWSGYLAEVQANQAPDAQG